MEKDNSFPNQTNKDFLNNKDIKTSQQNMILLEDKITNQNMEEKDNVNPNTSQEIDSSFNIGRTYNIILRRTSEKSRSNNEKELSPNIKDDSNSNDINKTKAASQNSTSINLKMSENEKKANDNQLLENQRSTQNVDMVVEDNNMNKDNILENRAEREYKKRYGNEEEVNTDKNYYNPFNEKIKNENKNQSDENISSSNQDKKYLNKKGKLPNIILTTFPISIKNPEEKSGKLYNFFNLFSSKKKEKQPEKNDEMKEDEKETEKIKTLEEKLKEENIIVNENENDKIKKRDIVDKKIDNYDFILSVIPSKKKESKEKENDDKKNVNNYIIEAEPIINNNNKEDMNNNFNDESNICISEQMEDIDKSSQYTSFSQLSIVRLINKNKKCSALLLAILLGSCGLLYLLYKKITWKELISKISELIKLVPGFFKGLLANIFDYLETFDDIYRFLAGISILVVIWYVIKANIKCFVNRRKK